MVASYKTGNPVRSFVRVPGSGTDKKAKSLCWDLSRSSTVAAAVQVEPTLPSAITITTLIKSSESTKEDGKTGYEDEVTVAQPASQTEELRHNQSEDDSRPADVAKAAGNEIQGAVAQTTTPTAVSSQSDDNSDVKSGGRNDRSEVNTRKRPYTVEPEEGDQNESSSSEPRAKFACVCGKTRESSSVDDPTTVMSPKIQETKVKESVSAEVSKLAQELEQVRQQNQELQKRLKLFHELFNDKKRLALVVKHLGVSVN
ncbi:uncharacterized protein LOC121877374 [Homarus americanus]|nr:uncharacterized protein LOC121877374 [Homarus americanus]